MTPKIDPAKFESYLQNISDEVFIETFMSIVSKDRQEVPFLLNTVQSALAKSWADWNIVLKYRKPGVSLYTQAKFLSRVLRRRNRNAVVLSFDKTASMEMLDRTHRIVDRLPFKVHMDSESKNEFSIRETNSKFYVGTPGTKAFGRGSDVTDLHPSEYAFWEDTSIMTGVMEALTRDSFVVVESTANGPSNAFARLYKKGRDGGSKWKSHFFPWWIDPELEMEPELGFAVTEDEKDLMARYPAITLRKLAWRRDKMRNMEDPELFPQEYPASENDAFILLSNCVFNHKSLSNYDRIVREPERTGYLSLEAM